MARTGQVALPAIVATGAGAYRARMNRLVFAFIVVALIAPAAAQVRPGPPDLPTSPLRIYPVVCEVPYSLLPGERKVLSCDARMPRAGLEGIAQISSGHDEVDAMLVRRTGLARFRFAVTNRGAVPIVAVAKGEQW